MTGAPIEGWIDLGHTNTIETLSQSENRLLSRDYGGRWVLWDIATRGRVAKGDGAGWSDLAGPTMAFDVGDGIELRSVVDGQLQAKAPFLKEPFQYHEALARDGSYVVVYDDKGLSAWSAADGSLLFSRVGNHAPAAIFPASGELRIAGGPAGAHVIERISIATGTSSFSPPFAGQDPTWFVNGERFLTNQGNVVYVYSKDVGPPILTQVSGSPSRSGGLGDFFWQEDWTANVINLYALANPGGLVGSYPFEDSDLAITAGSTLAIASGYEPGVQLIHLDAVGVTTTTVETPPASHITALGGDANGHWSFGNQLGAVYDDTNLSLPGGSAPLSCGIALDIAGSSTGVAAIALGADILLLQLDQGGQSMLARVPFASSHVELTTDGTLLAAHSHVYASQYGPGPASALFSLPSGAKLHEWGSALTNDIALASGGSRLVDQSVSWFFNGNGHAVYDLTTYDLAFSGLGDAPIAISPNGQNVAVPNGQFPSTASSTLYHDGALIGAVPGVGFAWLDDDHLLVSSFGTSSYPGSTFYPYLSCSLYDASGVMLPSPALPCDDGLSVVSPTKIYLADDNAIVDTTSGAVVWQGPKDVGGGAVAGAFVLFSTGGGIVIAPH